MSTLKHRWSPIPPNSVPDANFRQAQSHPSSPEPQKRTDAHGDHTLSGESTSFGFHATKRSGSVSMLRQRRNDPRNLVFPGGTSPLTGATASDVARQVGRTTDELASLPFDSVAGIGSEQILPRESAMTKVSSENLPTARTPLNGRQISKLPLSVLGFVMEEPEGTPTVAASPYAPSAVCRTISSRRGKFARHLIRFWKDTRTDTAKGARGFTSRQLSSRSPKFLQQQTGGKEETGLGRFFTPAEALSLEDAGFVTPMIFPEQQREINDEAAQELCQIRSLPEVEEVRPSAKELAKEKGVPPVTRQPPRYAGGAPQQYLEPKRLSRSSASSLPLRSYSGGGSSAEPDFVDSSLKRWQTTTRYSSTYSAPSVLESPHRVRGRIEQDAEYSRVAIADRGVAEPSYCSRWKQKFAKWKWPFTLDNYRWSLQEVVTVGLASLPSRFEAANAFFAGNGSWIAVQAGMVIDTTTGATLLRLQDRIAGTIVGAVLVVAIFYVVMGTQGSIYDEPVWKLVIVWLLVSLCGYIGGWLRFRWPGHPVWAFTTVYTVPVVTGAGLTSDNPYTKCLWRSVCCLIGVTISGIVTRFFIPKRARTDVLAGLAEILDGLSSTLEPLIELESGLVPSASFFKPTAQHGTGFRSEASWLGVPKDGSAATTTRVVERKVMVDFEAWHAFRDKLKARLDRLGKLTAAQLTMMRTAKREVTFRKSKSYRVKDHQSVVRYMRTLFFHATTLFTLITSEVTGPTKVHDEELLEEVEHWSKFGVLTIQSNAHAGAQLDAANLERLQQTEHPELRRTHSDMPNQLPGPSLRAGRGGAAGFIGGLSSHRQRASAEEIRNAELCATLRWAEIYGPTIATATRHICSALSAGANAIRETKSDPMIHVYMSRAGQAIRLFHEQRAERRQATAAVVDSILTDMNEDPLSKVIPHNRMERVLGLSVLEYANLSYPGRRRFWEAYWLSRDRLSTTDATMTSLFVAVHQALAALEELIRAQVEAKARGHKITDYIDEDAYTLDKQVAISKAGGHATTYNQQNYH